MLAEVDQDLHQDQDIIDQGLSQGVEVVPAQGDVLTPKGVLDHHQGPGKDLDHVNDQDLGQRDLGQERDLAPDLKIGAGLEGPDQGPNQDGNHAPARELETEDHDQVQGVR